MNESSLKSEEFLIDLPNSLEDLDELLTCAAAPMKTPIGNV